MAERTEIAWCDSTFNCWIGCTKVSPGCDNCYAARQDTFRKWTPAGWGAGMPRRRTSAQLWRDPVKWNAAPFFECPDCGLRGDAKAMGDEPKTCKHLNATAVRRRVFCASLADVFDNEVDAAWRRDLFALIRETPNLDWLLLTKRIGNAMKMLPWASEGAPGNMVAGSAIYSNVWLGATIVNQEEADRDIPKLLATPARVRFLSMEPLLGDVDVSQWLFPFQPCKDCPCPRPDESRVGFEACCKDPELLDSQLNWVIVGGESGPGARPMSPDWARSLRDQCAAAGVPFLFKQWGEFLPGDADADDPVWPDVPESRLYWSDGSKWDQFDGQRAGVSICARVGKKAAGRLLDGVEHNGFPT